MRRAGDVCFSQVFHEGSGKLYFNMVFYISAVRDEPIHIVSL